MTKFDINHLFTSLRERGITLKLDDNNDLEIIAPKGKLTPELIETIKRSKQLIVDYIVENREKRSFDRIPKAPQAESYPLTAAQRRLWLAIKLFRETLYNFNMAFTIREHLELPLLRKALLAVIKRHEILHTVFRETSDGEVRQYVLPKIHRQFDIPIYDLSGRSDAEEEAVRIMEADRPKAFDLEHGPLIRVIILKIAPDHHILYYSLHHLISDGWSLNILSQDALAYYNAFVDEQQPELQPLDIQYADFAVWEERMYREGRFDQQEAFWKKQLSGELSHIDLPIAKPRPSERTTQGGRFKTGIKATTVSRLKSFVEKERGSLLMGLLTVLKILFYRYTNERRLSFGLTISGRELPELQHQIGLYLNTLPLISEIEKGETFAGLFAKVRQACLDVYENQFYDLDRLLEEVNYQRDKSRNPLFDFVVVMQNFNENKFEDPDSLYFTEEIEEFGQEHIQYDMLFDFQEFGDFIDFRLLYNSDLYDKRSVRQLISHFRNLLEAALQDPDLPVEQLPMLGEKERNLLLHELNDTQTEFPHRGSVLDLLRLQIERHAERPAVVHGSESYTFRELDQRSDKLAQYLVAEGVQPGDLVGLCMDRSAGLVVSILATVKTGAAYIPIDPAQPQERIAYIVQAAECSLLLTDVSNQDMLEAMDLDRVKRLCLPNNGDRIELKIAVHLPETVGPESLLYVIFTSGSTGTPKGVQVAHSSMVNLAQWFCRHFDVQPGDNCTMMAGISFDAGALELWTTWLAGACVHIVEDYVKMDSGALISYFDQNKITHSTIPPVLLSGLLEGPQPDSLSLKSILIGGDRLPGIDTSRLSYQVVNGYGPTEATVMVSDHILNGPKDAATPPPIGKPIANTQLYVLNDAMQLQPIEVPGELYIGGAALAKGYLNEPDMTAAAFVHDPFSKEKDAILYRTGDIVKWRPEGTLEFIERRDKQVKVRGYRIELGEVEHALNQLPGVREGRVIVKRDHDGQNMLLAYYVGESAADPLLLRQGLSQSLPGYMIPAYFTQIDHFPMTTNGKIDRAQLPDPIAPELPKVTDVKPVDEIESDLLNIWWEVLGHRRVNPDSEFFASGGNSIKLMQLVNRYRETFGVKPDLREMFGQARLSDHAELIRSANRREEMVIRPLPAADDYPVSHAQQRLWVLSHLPEATLAYNMIGSFDVQGTHSPRLLEKIIWKVISRHEILRTVFRKGKDGTPRQVIIPEHQFDLRLSHIYAEETGEDTVRELLQQAAQEPFDLAEGPLLRGYLLHLNEEHCKLVFALHHIICDGWSVEILEREIRRYYDAYTQGQSHFDLEPLPFQYKDYASWQLEQEKNGNWERAATFWGQELSGELPVIDLLTDKVRPKIATHRGYRLTRTVQSKNTAKLQAFGADRGYSGFMMVLTALNILIHRYAGARDIVVGTAVAGRTNASLEQQVGLYLNTLPIRTQLSGKESFRELLQELRTTVLAAYEYQDYPFDKIVEDVEPEKDLSRSPLFGILVAYQNYDRQVSSTSSSASAGKVIEIGAVPVKYDLDFSFEEVADGWAVQVDFNTDLYEKGSIVRLLDHFCNLLEVVAAWPDAPVNQLEFLSEKERYQLRTVYNSTKSTLPKKSFLAAYYEQLAARENAVAISGPETTLTYRQLEESANQFAHYLLDSEWRKESFIPVHLERSPELIVALLGILKAGKAYVPIDASFPAERVRLILDEVGAGACLSDEHCIDRLGELTNEYTFRTMTFESVSDYPVRKPPVSVKVDSPAYIMYTSGSTSRPKGVVISHRALANYMEWVRSTYLDKPVEKMGLFSSISFDFTVTSLYGPLVSGGTLYIYPQDMGINEILQHQFEAGNGFTSVKLTPAHVQLIDSLNLTACGIKTAILGGEQLYPVHVRTLLDLNPTMKIYNEYGPTETTVGVSVALIEEEVSESVHIGRPITNTELYVLDEHQNLVPNGVAGELYIGGAQLAKGYHGNPELTQRSFLKNTFLPGELFYRTGDWVKRLPDGNIQFLGRIDDQVKIRGYRIELGEIETQLQRLDAVKEAVVLAREDQANEKHLVAYISTDQDLDRERIRKVLARVLPDYMVPRIYVPLPAFKLTRNGKVDRKALPAVDFNNLGLGAYVAPATNLEVQLSTIWQEVLGVEKVGMEDNFFELGGHSLKSIQLINRYAREFSVQLTMDALFEFTTISEHANLILNGRKSEITSIPKIENAPDYPVSFGQRRMWILSQSPEGSRAYHMPGTIRLEGELEESLLIKAIEKVVDRHEILRTVFLQREDGTLRQKVCSREELGFRVMTETIPNGKKGQKMLEQRIEAETERAFSLSEGPLFRVCLFKVKKDEYALFYNLHHIIGDGWSMDVLTRDILRMTEALRTETKEALPPLPIQYRDFAAWQLRMITDSQQSASERYWLEQLSGELPVLSLPAQQRRPLEKTYRGANLRFDFSEALSTRIKAFALAERGSVFMVLLAAFNTILHRYTQQRDIIVGTPAAGRMQPELEEQIGLYMNTLALRLQFPENISFSDLFKLTQQLTLQAFEHQDYPFDKLVDKLELKRDAGRNPIFDVMLIMQDAHQTDTRAGRDFKNSFSRIEQLEDHGDTSHLDLTLTFTEVEGRLLGSATYNTDIYTEAFMRQFVGHLEALLEAGLGESTQLIVDLPILSEAEQHQLLNEFNDTSTKYPHDQSVGTLFSRQAAETPDRIALVFEERSMTYRELDEISTQMAHYLLDKYALEPEELVGIKMKRSEWLIVSFLAVLKAGGAYVPMDMNYPPARLRFIEIDAKCKLIIDEAEIETFKAVSENYDHHEPLTEVSARHLAYAMYTSGSTGQPKGVLIEHRSIVRLVKSSDFYQFSSDDILLSTGSISFDVATFEYWGTLLNGSQLVLCSRETLLDTDLLSAEINRRSVNIMWFTAGWLNQLVETDISLFGKLKTLLAGGEKLSPFHIAKLREEYPDLEIINGYGPTENTTFSTTFSIGEVDGDLPIGRPISNSTVYIVADNGTLQPPWVTGEIWVGGAGVARGYLNQEELNRNKFVPCVFDEKERAYRTGDYGYWMPDGNVAFSGRTDEQVKIRGFRIEIGEIELALNQLAGIGQAVVLVDEPVNGNKRLIAYVRSESDIDTNEIRRQLSRQLPDYMIPSLIIPLAEIPTSANGKVDKDSLPLPEDLGLDDHTGYLAPANPKEEVLVDLYGKLLSGSRVGSQHSFFELGGDSIKAIQLASKVKERGYSITVGDVLQHPVIQNLASRMKPLAAHEPTGAEQVSGTVLLSPVQRWFFSMQQVPFHHFNQSILLQSSASLQPDLLRESLAQVMRHHDALRMVFRKEEEHWQQYNLPETEAKVALEILDLSGAEDATSRAQAAFDNLQQSFALSEGPLLKALLLRTEAEDQVLLVAHHLIIDGVSWRILLEDISTAYQALENGRPVQLPAKTHSYQYWSRRMAELANSDELQAEIPYWQSTVERGNRMEPLRSELPASSPDKVERETFAITYDKKATSRLMNRAQTALGVGVRDVLLSCLSLALAEVFDREAVLVNMEGHGREDILPDVNVGRTIGWFTSLYPLVLVSNNKEPVTDYLLKVKDTLEAIPRNGMGYGLLRYLRDEKILPELRSADIAFNYLGDIGEQAEEQTDATSLDFSDGYRGREMDHAFEEKLGMVCTGLILSGSLHLNISYPAHYYHSEVIDRLRGRLEYFLDQMNKHLQEVERTGVTVPLSYHQLEFFNGGKLIQANGSFDLTLAPFDKDRFRKVYREMVNRVDLLRLKVAERDGRLYQQIRPETLAAEQIVFLEQEQLDLESEEVRQLLQTVQLKPFDVRKEEIIRCGVVHDADKAVVLVVIHHLATDDASNRMLRAFFLDRYHQREPTPIQSKGYLDYVRSQRAFLKTVKAGEAIDFWEKTLQPLLNKPATAPISRHWEQEEIQVKSIMIEEADTQRLRDFCKKHHLLTSSVALTLCYLMEFLIRDAKLPLIQLLSDGRDESHLMPDKHQLIGQFINRLPLPIALETESSLLDIVEQVQDRYLSCRSHQEIPALLIESMFREKNGVELSKVSNQILNFFNRRGTRLSAEESDRWSMKNASPRCRQLTYCYEFENALVFYFNERIPEDREQAALLVSGFEGVFQELFEYLLQTPQHSLDDFKAVVS